MTALLSVRKAVHSPARLLNLAVNELNLAFDSTNQPGVFKNCKNLKKVEIKGNASFDTEAFKDCTSLESVIVKGKLCVNNGGIFIGGIGQSAFENCTSLETFKIYKMTCEGEGLSWYLGAKAFKNCKSLKTINIPNNCTGIYKEAFKNCISLETVKISAKCEIFRIDDNGD